MKLLLYALWDRTVLTRNDLFLKIRFECELAPTKLWCIYSRIKIFFSLQATVIQLCPLQREFAQERITCFCLPAFNECSIDTIQMWFNSLQFVWPNFSKKICHPHQFNWRLWKATILLCIQFGQTIIMKGSIQRLNPVVRRLPYNSVSQIKESAHVWVTKHGPEVLVGCLRALIPTPQCNLP